MLSVFMKKTPNKQTSPKYPNIICVLSSIQLETESLSFIVKNNTIHLNVGKGIEELISSPPGIDYIFIFRAVLLWMVVISHARLSKIQCKFALSFLCRYGDFNINMKQN